MKVAIIFTVHVCCLALAAPYPSLLVEDPYRHRDSEPCSIDVSCSNPSYDLQDVKISLSPNPPVPGKNVTITATGTLKKQISGGKIKLVAKYNSIQVLNQTYDVCYLVKQLDRQCPISAGSFSGSGTFMVPSFVIPVSRNCVSYTNGFCSNTTLEQKHRHCVDAFSPNRNFSAISSVCNCKQLQCKRGNYYIGVDGTDQDGGNLGCGQFTCQM